MNKFLAIFFIFSFLAQYAYAEELDITQALFLSEDYKGAIRQGTALLDKVTERDKDKLYYIIAMCLLKNKKYDEAREWMSAIIEQCPDSHYLEPAYIGLADSYLLDNMADVALDNYLKITDIFNTSEAMCQILYKIALSCAKTGEWTKAEEYFERIKKLYPYSFEAQLAAKNEDKAYFSVKVGVFSDIESAKSLEKSLKQKDYPAHIQEVKDNTQILYEVRVGKFISRAAVLFVEEKLRDEENLLTRILP